MIDKAWRPLLVEVARDAGPSALAALLRAGLEGKLDAELPDVFIARRVDDAAASFRPGEDLRMSAENR